MSHEIANARAPAGRTDWHLGLEQSGAEAWIMTIDTPPDSRYPCHWAGLWHEPVTLERLGPGLYTAPDGRTFRAPELEVPDPTP